MRSQNLDLSVATDICPSLYSLAKMTQFLREKVCELFNVPHFSRSDLVNFLSAKQFFVGSFLSGARVAAVSFSRDFFMRGLPT